MFVNFNILNQLGSPAINSNTFANRPAAGQTGRLFVSTDTFEIYRDNGTTWDLIGGPGSSTITGTGTATQVAYFTSSQAIGSSSNLYWDNTNTRLGIGTSTPGVRLDIHGTGTIQHINSTGGANNGYLAFQRAGTTTFSIGDTYNAGSNYFRIFSNSLSADVAQIFEATGKTVWQATQSYNTGLARANYFDYNLTVAAGPITFTSPNSITALGASLDLTLNGSATIPSGARTGLDAYNSVSFTSIGTLTMSQGTQIRPYSNLTTGWAFAGSTTGTITHLAGLRVLFPDNSGSAVSITNNYGLLINDQTANTGTVTYSNRWGIYQEGTSDLNYLAANTLIGTTVNSGEKLVVSGTAKATNLVIDEQVAPATPSSGTGIIYAQTDNSLYFKNDAGQQFNLTPGISGNNTTIGFNALGSQFIGFPVIAPNFMVTGSNTIGSGTLEFSAYYITNPQTVTGIKFFQGTQGVYTANNYNGVGLYSYSGGTLTLVASSTNDGNIWKGTSQTWQTKAFSSPYNASAGIYFVSFLYSSSAVTTAPAIGQTQALATGSSAFDFTNSAKISANITGQTALPSSQAMSGLTASVRTYILALY